MGDEEGQGVAYIGIYRGAAYQREVGDPERFNGNSLAAMDGTGPMGNVIVLFCCCFRGVPRQPLPVGFDEQGLRRKT